MFKRLRWNIPVAVLLISVGASAVADPHYVQALHPYWGTDEQYAHYLKKFTGDVDFDVRSSSYDDGTPVYIYEYSISIPNADAFILDIRCPGAEARRVFGVSNDEPVEEVAFLENASPDPVAGNPDPVITEDGWISWVLSPGTGRQAMWFYSWSPPVKRAYRVTTAEGEVRGTVQGPACRSRPH